MGAFVEIDESRVEILGKMGPFSDGDADIYFCALMVNGHVYCKRLVIGGCAKAVRSDLNDEIAYQTVKAAKELVRELRG